MNGGSDSGLWVSTLNIQWGASWSYETRVSQHFPTKKLNLSRWDIPNELSIITMDIPRQWIWARMGAIWPQKMAAKGEGSPRAVNGGFENQMVSGGSPMT